MLRLFLVDFVTVYTSGCVHGLKAMYTFRCVHRCVQIMKIMKLYTSGCVQNNDLYTSGCVQNLVCTHLVYTSDVYKPLYTSGCVQNHKMYTSGCVQVCHLYTSRCVQNHFRCVHRCVQTERWVPVHNFEISIHF